MLATRSQVLATRYSVVPVSDVDELEAQSPDSAFQVLVLCHTLSERESAAAFSLSKERWPGIAVVSIVKSGSDRPPGPGNATFRSLEGPRALLACISDAVQREEMALLVHVAK